MALGAPVVAVVTLTAAVFSAGVARTGAAAAERARAEATADVTAAAAVLDGPAAGGVASANHARLLSVVRHSGVTVVRVDRGGVVATAAARPAHG